MVVFELAATVLLLRTLKRSHPLRALFSLLSIGFSGVVIALLTAFLWLFFSHTPHG